MAENRIKGLRQKTQTGYDSFVPFGADGRFIDMDSSLNLEQELKIGGNHTTSIIADQTKKIDGITYSGVTVIKEGYALKNELTDNSKIFYNVVTLIYNIADIAAENHVRINITLYKTVNGVEHKLKTKVIDIIDNKVVANPGGSLKPAESKIEEVLQ